MAMQWTVLQSSCSDGYYSDMPRCSVVWAGVGRAEAELVAYSSSLPPCLFLSLAVAVAVAFLSANWPFYGRGSAVLDRYSTSPWWAS